MMPFPFPPPLSPRPQIFHIHIRDPITYTKISLIQDHIIQLHQHARQASSTHPPVPATVLTFSTPPTYTLGRRETDITQRQRDYLAAPVRIPRITAPIAAQVIKTLRGGQTTFHGPGQLIIYPIFTIDAPRTQIPRFPRDADAARPKASQYGITPRRYVRLLEDTTIAALRQHGVQGMRTMHPGVWVSEAVKIAAVGVHLRRWVVGHGVALNVHTDLEWFERIVACGLVGKKTTSMREVLLGRRQEVPVLRDVARDWVREFAGSLGFDPETDVVYVEKAEETLGCDLGG